MPTVSALCFDLAASPGGIPSQRMVLPFCKLDATTDPGPSNDGAQRYLPGSQWFNATTRTLFVCKDNAAGAAVWREVGIGRTIPARVATTASLDLSADLQPGDAVDGVTLAAGDVVLVKDQATPSPPAPVSAYSAGKNDAAGTGGTAAWSPAGSVFGSALAGAPDGSGVTCIGSAGDRSRWLIATGFGFSLPLNATVVGIEVTWTYAFGGATPSTTYSARVVDGSGAILAADLSTHPAWPSSYGTETVGGPTNLCGGTWTPGDINAGAFGAAIAVDFVGAGTAAVDACEITIHYTVPTTGPKDNGPYVVRAAAAPIRHPDANTGAELVASLVYVKRGTVGAHTLWANTDEAIAVGVDDVNYAQL
jgi:hypothetical protein